MEPEDLDTLSDEERDSDPNTDGDEFNHRFDEEGNQ